MTAGVLTITNSTISGNRSGDGHIDEGRGGDGAGIYNGHRLDMFNTTMNDNVAGKGLAGGDGGGIYVGPSTVANISNSTFFGNAAGGFPGDGTFQGGFGGAVSVDSLNATVNITSSTFFANRPGVTVNGPSVANGKGGAIAVPPRLDFPSVVNVRNTIIAENVVISVPDFQVIVEDCFGSIVDGGYNIDWRNSCGFSVANNSQINTDPRLVPSLQDNGGPTRTMALCTGVGMPHPECDGMSPAIDAIPNGTNGCGAPMDTDQRGVARPVDGDGDAVLECDIGAFEVVPPPPPLTCFGRVPTIVGTDGNDVLIGTSGPDVIMGLGGDDLIRGLDGDDVICGGDGNDRIEGGNGNDLIDGGEGNDLIKGQNGDDTILGGGGNDTIEGGPGNDSLDGGPGTDRLKGGLGTDTCVNGEIVQTCE